MLPQATTLRLRAPTVTVRPIKRTIFKRLKMRVESFDALCRTLGPTLKMIIGLYEEYTIISSADQDIIREMVLTQIWLNKTRIHQRKDAMDYVIVVIIEKVHAFFREMGCPEKLHDIALQMRVARTAQS